MKNLSLIVAMLMLMGVTGCATVTRGDKQKVRFDTDPAGATVAVADQTLQSPVTIELKRKIDYPVKISKEGYRTIVFVMRGRWDGAAVPFNLVAPGGTAMAAADHATGADMSFYDVPKIKLQAAASGTPPLEMVMYKGTLYTQTDYEKEVQAEADAQFRHRN